MEEKRIRMDITVLPAIKTKLQELEGDYSLSAVIEDCLLDYFELTSNGQKVQGRGYARLHRGHR
jgi:hypothetical protein